MGLRNRTIAKLGLRNIPRRRSQSALIILGLTLSTIIIVSALSIGDTLSYSVRRHAINAYGTIDQVISPPLLSALAGFVTSAADGEEPGDPLAPELSGVLKATCSASWDCSRRGCRASPKNATPNSGIRPRQTRPPPPWWTGWLLHRLPDHYP